jgi:chloramphenicol O-acetyltransferase type A
LEKLDEYDRIAMMYHTREEQISFSDFSITTKLDVERALNNYNASYKNSSSSFIIFLIYKLNIVLNNLKKFNYKFINDTWYYFEEVPMTLPVTYNNEYRFITLDNFNKLDWKTFSEDYREKVNRAKYGENSLKMKLDYYYAFGNFFSNFPSLNFTSFSPHTVVYKRTTGLNYFATGTILNKSLPFSITTHHSISNGNYINDLVQNLIKELNS